MTSIFQSPGPASDDLVVTAVEEEIRQEALRQVESVDCDDDQWRMEPLPTFSDRGDSTPPESRDQENRHNN